MLHNSHGSTYPAEKMIPRGVLRRRQRICNCGCQRVLSDSLTPEQRRLAKRMHTRKSRYHHRREEHQMCGPMWPHLGQAER